MDSNPNQSSEINELRGLSSLLTTIIYHFSKKTMKKIILKVIELIGLIAVLVFLISKLF
jgi:hypothetical protein